MKTRGACPSIAEPMQTGDGLLARLMVHEPISIEKLCALSVAAETFGNGIIEVTQRGNLQIRGLSDTTAPQFAEAVNTLQIGADQTPALLTSPLLGLEASEPCDSTALVAALLAAFRAAAQDLKALGPKVSVLIDGGGPLHLDGLSADIRLRAQPGSLFQLCLAGTAHQAEPIAQISAAEAPQTVVALLRQIAQRGPTARAGMASVQLAAIVPARPQPPADPVGTHALKDGTRALGFALPFGHTTATALRRAALTAAAHGATALRPAPGRTLLAIAMPVRAIDTLRESLAAAGFIVDPRDPRRQVIACVGSPSCASARLPARQLAPEVARAIGYWAGTGKLVHLAGCAKGCAHPGPATVTVVGPDQVILNGRASDPTHTTLSSIHLIADLERLCREQ
jgi:precorrin-3B synthase